MGLTKIWKQRIVFQSSDPFRDELLVSGVMTHVTLKFGADSKMPVFFFCLRVLIIVLMAFIEAGVTDGYLEGWIRLDI